MLQRLLTKRLQVQLNRRRKVARALREVGPSERRRGADSRGKVGDQGQVQHLLDGDAVQRLAPPINNLCLLGGETFVGALFETELRKEVLAHDHVLELRGFGQQPPHIFAVGDDDPGLHHCYASVDPVSTRPISPSTTTRYVISGSIAGPRNTSPEQTLNCEPCSGQVIVEPSSLPLSSGPPRCGHLAWEAQNFPSTLKTAASPTSAADPGGTSLT